MAFNASESLEHHIYTEVVNPTVLEFVVGVNLVFLADVIGCSGVVANVVNIIIFKKQGLHDSVNVTLTALSLCDFFALLCQLVVNIMFFPTWKRVEIPFSSASVLGMQFFYLHSYFIRVSGFITAFAATERLTCVVQPMRVKEIFTKNVAVVANILIFIILFIYLFPVLYVSYLDWIYIPIINRTVLTVIFRDNAENVLTISNFVNDLFIPYITFFILIICTIAIVVKLRTKSKWRRSVSGSKGSSGMTKRELSTKETRAVVMLTVVSVMYITCLTPECVLMTVIGFTQDMKIEGPYWDLTLVIYSCTSLLETINCSITIILYYSMSSNYRETMLYLFRTVRKKYVL